MYIQTFPYFISTLALLVSVAGYLLNRKMLNQNKVFDEKIKSYSEILKTMNKAFNVLIGNLHEGIRLTNEKPEAWEDERDELADQIDEEIVAMEDAMIVGSLVLPGEIVEQFDQFSDFMDNVDADRIFENPEKLGQVVETLNEKFRELFDLMRNDLDADKLNNGLRKRIRGTWMNKIVDL